ncbi:hypothetical protein D9758_018683 [Tetrapyrgos nigripes]|uniref:Uncharacterized protein n=1 Tax=Tetrapyrgos nigripes TaxID=182062 RepID=A0A8H5B7R2_9AGAR|nr:hypothetical protein D9758_018683 [Tetrapyrgos nigripes]
MEVDKKFNQSPAPKESSQLLQLQMHFSDNINPPPPRSNILMPPPSTPPTIKAVQTTVGVTRRPTTNVIYDWRCIPELRRAVNK